MSRYLCRPLLAAVIGVAGFATTGLAQQTDRDSIAGLYKAWSDATAAEGAAGYARFLAPAARVVPPGGSPIVGRDSIGAWMERTQREATTTTQPESVTQDEITIAGSYAMVITTLRGRRVPRDATAPVPFETRYVDVLERTPAGWMVTYRTWTDRSP